MEPVKNPNERIPLKSPEADIKNESLNKRQGYAEGGMVLAIQAKGKQITGEPGQSHADILKANKIGKHQRHTRGHVGEDGKFVQEDQ